VVVLNNGSNYGARSSVLCSIFFKISLYPFAKLTLKTPHQMIGYTAFVDLQATERRPITLQTNEPVREASAPMLISTQQVIGNLSR